MTNGIKQKLLEVSKAIEYLKKDKKNTGQGYNYLSEAKIKEVIKREFEKQGILFNYSTSSVSQYEISLTQKGTKQFCTTATGTYRFLDTESGDEISGTWAGTGSDTGDKGLYKAITGGIKYVLNTNFLIPTGDDPEKDESGHAVQMPQAKQPTEKAPKKPAEFDLNAKIGGKGKYANETWNTVDVGYLEKCKDFDKLPDAFRAKCKKAFELRVAIPEDWPDTSTKTTEQAKTEPPRASEAKTGSPFPAQISACSHLFKQIEYSAENIKHYLQAEYNKSTLVELTAEEAGALIMTLQDKVG